MIESWRQDFPKYNHGQLCVAHVVSARPAEFADQFENAEHIQALPRLPSAAHWA
jgi:hypothetical protein